MRGNGEGTKGEWPPYLKIGDQWEGRGIDGVFCPRKGNYKREGKRARRKREWVKSHGQKKGGVSGGYSGGNAAWIAMVTKSRIFVLAALWKSIDFITNFSALDSD